MARMFILGTQTDHLHSTSPYPPGGGPGLGQPSPGSNQHHPSSHRRGHPRSRHQQNQSQSNQNPNTRLFVTMKPRGKKETPTQLKPMSSMEINKIYELFRSCHCLRTIYIVPKLPP